MENEHTKVMTNLTSVNEQYSAQVSENLQLRSQLQVMQTQHTEMMSRFEQIEKKLNEKEAAPNKNVSKKVRHGQILQLLIKKLKRLPDR